MGLADKPFARNVLNLPGSGGQGAGGLARTHLLETPAWSILAFRRCCHRRYPAVTSLDLRQGTEAAQEKEARMRIAIAGPFLAKAALCEPVLRALPAWFGIEEANAQYLRDIEELPTFLARVDGQVLGFLTLREHTAYVAEIHIVAVHPEAHRQGMGRALLAAAERYLAQRGIEYLQVKTLSSAHPDEGYGRTRAFYEAVGFRPLEEFPELWGPQNPCLQMIKRL